MLVADWLNQIEEFVHELLDWAGYVDGEVDALPICQKMGYRVVYDRHQSVRGRLKRISGRVTIFLRPDTRPERIQWALSHEIGEALAFHVFRRMGIKPHQEQPGLREQVANLLATRLLLPRHVFFSHAEAHQGDLTELKQIFSTASYELIALRLLDRTEPICVTIVDQGRITKRRSNSEANPGGWRQVEQALWQEVHETSQFQDHQLPDLWLRCWPIHEPHWKREILLTCPEKAGLEKIPGDPIYVPEFEG